jgi:hypothetical protein
MDYCLIGSGTAVPAATNTTLDVIQSVAMSEVSDSKFSYDPSEGSLYKTSVTRKYEFSNIDGEVVAEVGLASMYSSEDSYNLCTRALIKDTTGKVAPITIPTGGTLTIYYKLWAVYDTADKTGVVNLINNLGSTVKYNYKIRPAHIGTRNYLGDDSATFILGNYLRGFTDSSADITLYDEELSELTTAPSSAPLSDGVKFVLSNYAQSSFKRQLTATFPLETSNGTFRVAVLTTSLGHFQIRYGTQSGDNPITKKDTQVLTLPFEISWAAYTGTL